ncbi:MAG: hypothetical protein JWM16_2395 [Verrucomicrobiales bacterium]|nr:hypothetical protein [Verrucomicrobiales bacterium]
MFRGDRFITPLYRMQPGDVPEGGGTGIWLQVENEKFLVTAAHVIEDGFIWFPMNKGFKRLNSPGVITNSPTGSRNDDRGDFAGFHLAPEDTNAKHPFHEFVQMSEVDVNLNYQFRDRYEFTGFPWRREELDHILKQTKPGFMSVTSEMVREKTFGILGLSIHTHVVIAFHRKKMMREGVRTTAPLPHGMSGGAVWKRYTQSEVRKLSAVAIEYRGNCLIGSRISGALEYIRARFPWLSKNIPQPLDVEIVTTKNGRSVQPCAVPNGGAATLLDDSRATGLPPSISGD